MPTSVDRRPSVDIRVGILPAQAPGLSRRDGAKVVEIFGGCDNFSEVERSATSAATDFRLNHKPRKKTKEDNQLRKLFNEYDTNGDGSLDALEMTNVLKSMNLFESDGQVAAIIKGLDANGDGKVQLRELANFLNSKPEKNSRPEEEEEQATDLATAIASADGKVTAAGVNNMLAREFGIESGIELFEDLVCSGDQQEIKLADLVEALSSPSRR